MKSLFALAAFAVSISASAFDLKTNLDFSNIYGNTNAGMYEMKVSFTPKTTVSQSKLAFNVHQDDGYFTCLTTANFEIGQMNLELTNQMTGEITTVNETVFASVGKQVDGQVCDENMADLTGAQTLYALTGPKQAIPLNAKAPFDYTSVGAWLNPLNGYLYLTAELSMSGHYLVVNPAKLLTKESILATNSDHLTATYYVFATKDATTLSLATGIVDLK